MTLTAVAVPASFPLLTVMVNPMGWPAATLAASATLPSTRAGHFTVTLALAASGAVPLSVAADAMFGMTLQLAAVVGLVKSLANEFGKDGILVNNVGPGFTATDRLKELAKSRSSASGKSEQEIFDGWAADAPLKRLGDPRELAETIVWLASERASYITGQTVLVDGGMYKGL